MSERLQTRIEEVTSRQLEVARLVAEGRTNPEIAAALGITLDGAKYHVSELLGRLGLERREEIRDWYRSERRGQHLRRFGALFATVPKAFATGAAVAAIVAIGAMLAAGLEGGRAEDLPTAAATPTSAASEVRAEPAAGASGDASNAPVALHAVSGMLAERLRSASPDIVSWERVDWFNGCFDLDYPGGCPLSVSPVPGYRVVLRHSFSGDEYVARTDLGGARYRLEAAPVTDPVDIAFRWTGTTEYLCIDLVLASDGTGTIASCGEAPTPIDLSNSNVGRSGFLDAVYLQHLMSFPPFDYSDPVDSSTVTVYSRGAGTNVPDGWGRAADEWGRVVAIEAYSGHSNPSVAAIWSDAEAPDCTEAEVWRSGMVHLSGCVRTEDRVEFLRGVALPRLHSWLDRGASFAGDVDGATLEFLGDGQESDASFREMVQEWLAALAAGPTADE